MDNAAQKFLEVHALKKSFGSGDTRQDVLKGIDFTVAKKGFCVLLRPSDVLPQKTSRLCVPDV